MRDFEALISNVDDWLTTEGTRERLPSWNNVAGVFSTTVNGFEYVEEPPQVIMGQRAHPLIRRVGSVTSIAVSQLKAVDGRLQEPDATVLSWNSSDGQAGLCAVSSLLGDRETHTLDDLPGVLKDRVYDQIAIPFHVAVSSGSV